MRHEVIPFKPGQDGILFRMRGSPWFSPLHFHTHDDLEFNLVVSGHGMYLTADGRFHVRGGHLFWWFPTQPHALQRMSEDFAMWVAIFPRRLLRSACCTGWSRPLLMERPPESGNGVMVLPEILEELQNVIERLASEKMRGASGDWLNAGYRFLLMSAWRATVEGAMAPSESQALHPGVYRAARLLHDAPERESLKEVAVEVGLSYEHLCREFRRQVGTTLVEYRNEQRLRRYGEVYRRRPELGRMGAALEAGFGSYAQFYRVYRKHFGCAPASQKRMNGISRGRVGYRGD